MLMKLFQIESIKMILNRKLLKKFQRMKSRDSSKRSQNGSSCTTIKVFLYAIPGAEE